MALGGSEHRCGVLRKIVGERVDVHRRQDVYVENRLVRCRVDALLSEHLDVAILRVTRQMVADHPSGWHYRLLRLEPMLLVGRGTDPRQPTASFDDRTIEVSADTPGSGMYNVHGDFLSASERDTGTPLRWLGNPGTFNNCLAALMRATTPAYMLEFASYVERYAAVGLPGYQPLEYQPLYPWSIAW